MNIYKKFQELSLKSTVGLIPALLSKSSIFPPRFLSASSHNFVQSSGTATLHLTKQTLKQKHQFRQEKKNTKKQQKQTFFQEAKTSKMSKKQNTFSFK